MLLSWLGHNWQSRTSLLTLIIGVLMGVYVVGIQVL